MPLEIVRNDITKMQVDAIVNTGNTSFQKGGGEICYPKQGIHYHVAIKMKKRLLTQSVFYSNCTTLIGKSSK